MSTPNRVIAVCEGGPLDGQVFSVPLGEDGQPAPMFSRYDILGDVLYIPKAETAHTAPLQAQFAEAEMQGGKLTFVNQIAHGGAWTYTIAEVSIAADLVAAHIGTTE